MAFTHITTDTTTQITGILQGGVVLIDEGVTVSVFGAAAIDATTAYDQRSFFINGAVYSDATYAVNVTGAQNDVRIGEGGTVIGASRAVYVGGNGGRFSNAGEVHGIAGGIVTSGTTFDFDNSGSIVSEDYAAYIGSSTNDIRNSGNVVGNSYGFYVTGSGTTLVNTGEIGARNNGISLTASVAEWDVIKNTGTISGKYAILAGSSFQNVVNSGDLLGKVDLGGGYDYLHNNGAIADDVNLGDGDDSFWLGRNGTVTGIVDGGTGSDEFHLNGGTVERWVLGGQGDDRFYVTEAGVTLQESQDGGTDSVYASASWALGANFENLTLSNAGNLDGTGNALANKITGNAGDNRLAGNAGDDWISGGFGNDMLFGGGGNDTASYDYADCGVVADLASGKVLLDGHDRDSLSGIENLRGTIFSDILSGDAGNNTLDGADGKDMLDGRAGNDLLIGGNGRDSFVFELGYGRDEIQYFEGTGKAHDVVDLSGQTLLGTFEDVIAHAKQVDTDVVITFNRQDRLTLSDTDLADLRAVDFLF
jgi:Ca2+-binding RTX toxin-like protein